MTNKYLKELLDLLMYSRLPQHVSASGWHLQGVVGTTMVLQNALSNYQENYKGISLS
jgi:hypothetical protein